MSLGYSVWAVPSSFSQVYRLCPSLLLCHRAGNETQTRLMRATVMARDLSRDRIHLYLIHRCSGKLFFLVLQTWICWQVCSLPYEESTAAGKKWDYCANKSEDQQKWAAESAHLGSVEFPDPVLPIVMHAVFYLPRHKDPCAVFIFALRWHVLAFLFAALTFWLMQNPMQLRDGLQWVCKCTEPHANLCGCVLVRFSPAARGDGFAQIHKKNYKPTKADKS